MRDLPGVLWPSNNLTVGVLRVHKISSRQTRADGKEYCKFLTGYLPEGTS